MNTLGVQALQVEMHRCEAWEFLLKNDPSANLISKQTE
jgi:hypothetical protein